MKTLRILSLLITLLVVVASCNKGGICLRGRGGMESKEFILSEIEGIHLEGSGKIYISRSDEQKVVVSTKSNLMDYLNTNVSGKIWRIKFNRCVNNSDLEVHISLPHLSSVRIDGSGKIISYSTFVEDRMDIAIEGSGEISIPLEANQLKASIEGSGDILLSGIANEASYAIEGSGSIKAYEVLAAKTKAIISGSGRIETSTTDRLDAEITGSGRILYKGNPVVNSNISGSGKVLNKN